jgi:hypothetical protein
VTRYRNSYGNRNLNFDIIPFAKDESPKAKSEDTLGNPEYSSVHGYKYWKS